MKGRNFLKSVLTVVILLSGCVPSVQDSRPAVAILNGPTESRLEGLADRLQDSLASAAEQAIYRLVRPFPLRFQETHRDMYGSRAPLQAAFAARSQGADYAVLVGLNGDRDLEGVRVKDSEIRFTVLIEGTFEVIVIDASSAETLTIIDIPAFSVRKAVNEPLPEGMSVPSSAFRKLIDTLAVESALATRVLVEVEDFEATLNNLALELDAYLSVKLDQDNTFSESQITRQLCCSIKRILRKFAFQ